MCLQVQTPHDYSLKKLKQETSVAQYNLLLN